MRTDLVCLDVIDDRTFRFVLMCTVIKETFVFNDIEIREMVGKALASYAIEPE